MEWNGTERHDESREEEQTQKAKDRTEQKGKHTKRSEAKKETQ
jgi:hypothetical protein